jgi:hypothetical protein
MLHMESLHNNVLGNVPYANDFAIAIWYNYVLVCMENHTWHVHMTPQSIFTSHAFVYDSLEKGFH